MALKPALFEIRNLDKGGSLLRVGDRVGFISRGWFAPREQETFGVITEIDARGGIRIQPNENYKCFGTNGKVLSREPDIYFTHFRYIPELRARVYHTLNKKFELMIYRIDPDENPIAVPRRR